MPFVNITKDTWNSVVTTTEDTLVQNRGARTVFITTESTSGKDLDEGIALGSDQAVQIASGKTVSASAIGADGIIFYTAV